MHLRDMEFTKGEKKSPLIKQLISSGENSAVLTVSGRHLTQEPRLETPCPEIARGLGCRDRDSSLDVFTSE